MDSKVRKYLAEIGQKGGAIGGLSRSEKKLVACKKNGFKKGNKWGAKKHEVKNK